MPTPAGTAQCGYTGGTAQPGYTGGTTSQSTMPATSATSHRSANARMSRHEEIVEVQQKLQQDNLYNGRIDGRLNRQTRQALQSFQKQNGLRVTGTLDRGARDKPLRARAMG